MAAKHIDHDSLYSSLDARVAYLVDFIEFGAVDIQALKDIAPLLTPLVPTVLDAVYAKLFTYDITKSAFLPRQSGFEGAVPQKLDDLHLDSDTIKFRKDFLKVWIVKLLTGDYASGKNFEYLDKVGVMHTGQAGFKHREKKAPINVEYIHLGMLLGWVQTMLTSTLLGLPEETLPMSDKIRMVVAVNKILWIQNDLMARHYVKDVLPVEV